ncbi:MAG: preprotein translocase subunit SecG [Lachnospiraceae bacterium]|nr:preprotein translocase subunit SecG [Lachnospiraceae bacterium]
MSAARIFIMIVFIAVCAFLVYLVYLGKGEGADLTSGIVTRNNDTFYSTHGKKHTKDALRVRVTVIFTVIFLVLAVVLNMNWGLS